MAAKDRQHPGTQAADEQRQIDAHDASAYDEVQP
jgi:hypothetical protein